MNRRITACVSFLFFISSYAVAQDNPNGIVKYFKPWLTDHKFKSTYISSTMFSTILKTKKEELDKETADIIKDLTSLHVLTSENHSPDKQYNEAVPKVDTKEYMLLFAKQDQVDKFTLFVKKEGEKINELILIARDHVDFVILSITGNINLEKITKLAEALHFQGSEFLEQMNLSEDSLRKLHYPGKNEKTNELP